MHLNWTAKIWFEGAQATYLGLQKNQLQAKPWISKELLSKIQQKRKLCRSHYLNGDETEKQIYKNFANKLNKAKTKAKQIYFREQFLNN